jgi:hypothetical protein
MSENSTLPSTPRALLRPILRAAARLLTFRLTADEFARLDYRHLCFGLFCTWVVGMGRWWDGAGARWWQHAGAGSLIYIFILALLLWLVVLPLKPHAWTYRHVLTFVSLTAPPALLYAIPVEKFTGLATARSLNVWFLATVALWRVALLFNYLKRHARLRPFAIFTAALLPITAIIVALSALNLERAVFDVMGGLREQGTANDNAYAILFLLSLLSMLLFLPLLACYIVLVVLARSKGDEYRVASGS